ncbi:MAG: hypothetical protein LC114_01860 [Bryobacterales bacterium]|nr:hypothetical protein [Bryobacterales bacterium]
MEHLTGSGGGPVVIYDRKHEEYAADFILIAKRTLSDDEYRLFKFHYLLGADWKLCCARLKMDRGRFFHSVYRIQQKLGRAFRETEPYGIFPVYAYFEEERRKAQSSLPAADSYPDRGDSSHDTPHTVWRMEPGRAKPGWVDKQPGIGGKRAA